MGWGKALCTVLGVSSAVKAAPAHHHRRGVSDESNTVSNSSSSPATNFPPAAWLGFGLNMLAVNALDLDSVQKSIKRGVRTIRFGTNYKPVDIPGGSYWDVPDGIQVSTDTQEGDGTTQTFKSGSEASEALAAHLSGSLSYKIVQGDAYVDAGIENKFSDNKQYAMFGFTGSLVTAEFAPATGYKPYINDEDLLDQMNVLAPWDENNATTKEDFMTFFETMGTHIVKQADYGSRLSLSAWMDNSDSEINGHFRADLDVAFQGLTNGGKFDAGIETSAQYKTFNAEFGKVVSCGGGDIAICDRITANPQGKDVYDLYIQWAKSAQALPEVTTFSTDAIWDVMVISDNPGVKGRFREFKKAYEYFTTNPTVHITHVEMHIQSDWAEFSLLTPEASIERIDGGSFPEGTRLENSSIRWDLPPGWKVSPQRIDFQIRNYGSPIDFETGHGTDSWKPEEGKVDVTIQKPYRECKNDVWTDHELNLKRFDQVLVNEQAVGQVHIPNRFLNSTEDDSVQNSTSPSGNSTSTRALLVARPKADPSTTDVSTS